MCAPFTSFAPYDVHLAIPQTITDHGEASVITVIRNTSSIPFTPHDGAAEVLAVLRGFAADRSRRDRDNLIEKAAVALPTPHFDHLETLKIFS